MAEPESDKPGAGDELFIHLNLAGLAALMGTVEEAMVRGRSELSLGWGGVTVTGGGSAAGFASLTLTYVERPGPDDDDDGTGRPDPLPRTTVLVAQV